MHRLSTTTAALERALATIAEIHPDVRPAVLVVFRNPTPAIRGHYAHDAWTIRADSTTADEIHISSTILAQGAESVLRTLLHEAAHSMALNRNVEDTSRQGRWHNKRFRALAAEVGLEWAADTHIGTITPAITPAALAVYRRTLEDLDKALTLYQSDQAQAPAASATRMLKATCPTCSRIIRASTETYTAGPIICQPCGEEFQLTESN